MITEFKIFEIKYTQLGEVPNWAKIRFNNIKFNVKDNVILNNDISTIFTIIDIQTTMKEDFYWYQITPIMGKLKNEGREVIPDVTADKLRLATDFEIDSIKYNI